MDNHQNNSITQFHHFLYLIYFLFDGLTLIDIDKYMDVILLQLLILFPLWIIYRDRFFTSHI